MMILSSGFFLHLLYGKREAVRNLVANRSIPLVGTLAVFALIQVEFFSIVMLHLT
jgi:hypothetical protein